MISSTSTHPTEILDSHDELVSADELDALPGGIFDSVFSGFPFYVPVASVLDKAGQETRYKARQTYWRRTESLLNQPIGDRLLLDKNPSLTDALPAINWALPEMKMLIALRDPRDVILSSFLVNTPLAVISVNWLSIAEAADFYVHQMQMLAPSPVPQPHTLAGSSL